MRPSYGISFSTARSSVVLPEPLRPMSAVMRPRVTPAVTPDRIRVPPSSTLTFWKSRRFTNGLSFHRLGKIIDGPAHADKVVVGVQVGGVAHQGLGVGGFDRVYFGQPQVHLALQ